MLVSTNKPHLANFAASAQGFSVAWGPLRWRGWANGAATAWGLKKWVIGDGGSYVDPIALLINDIWYKTVFFLSALSVILCGSALPFEAFVNWNLSLCMNKHLI